MTSGEPPFDDAQALRALGHPLRLQIMRHLAGAPATQACEFVGLLDTRQPTVSQHLKVLRDAQLVETERRGNQICYSVSPEAIAALGGLLAGLGGTAEA